MPLVKISKPVVLHIEEEALWLLIFYYFICTFLRSCGSFCDLPISVPFVAILFVLCGCFRSTSLEEFSLKGIFPKMGLLILIS